MLTFRFILFFAFAKLISTQRRICSDELITSTISETRVIEQVFKADIALVIDSSDTIHPNNYIKQINFCKSIVSKFLVGPNHVRFGLIEFSGVAYERLHWENGFDSQTVLTKLASLKQIYQGTDFAAPFEMVKDSFISSGKFRNDAAKIVLFLTDGDDDYSSTYSITDALRKDNVTIFAVASIARVEDISMNALATITGSLSRAMYIDKFDQITNELERIKQDIVHLYKDCVYQYVPDCKCQFNRSGVCVQEGKLNILEPNHPAGKSCPIQSTVQLPCPASKCHKQCDRWPWGVWLMCEKQQTSIYHQNHENGTEVSTSQNGTRTRYRSKKPVDYWMNFGCQYNQTEECDLEKQKKMFLKHIQKYDPCPEDHTRFYVNMCVFLVGGLLFLAATLLLVFNVVMFSGTWVSSVLPPKKPIL